MNVKFHGLFSHPVPAARVKKSNALEVRNLHERYGHISYSGVGNLYEMYGHISYSEDLPQKLY